MRYGASFLAYVIWVHKNAASKTWLMRVKGLKNQLQILTFYTILEQQTILLQNLASQPNIFTL